MITNILEPDVEACSDEDSLGQIVEVEPEFVTGDDETRDCSEDDGGLEHEAASDATEDDSSLGEPCHEVEKTWPATKDGDEDDDEGGDPGHVLQLSS